MFRQMFPALHTVGERIGATPHLFLGLDYDGTLTPIVADPAEAMLAPAMRQALGALARRGDVTLAVISGRGHADLQNLVGIPGIIYASNHGMEILGPGISYVEPIARRSADRLALLGRDIAARLDQIPGAFVEDKRLTLSVHYRQAAPVEVEEVWRIVRNAVEPYQDAFQVTLGDKVHEIRPRTRWNKGAAVNWIRGQIGKPDALAVYIGDDATDEDAFKVLGDGAVTIRVGDRAETAAQFLLPDPGTVMHFLHWIAELREQAVLSEP